MDPKFKLARSLTSVSAQLWLHVPDDPDRASVAARQWMETGFAEAGHELRDRVLEAVETGAYLGTDYKRTVDGGVRALCGMKAYIDERLVDWYLAYSPKRWRRLLDQFTVLPESAELTIRVWQRSERSGVLVMRPGTGLEVSCGRIDDFPGWLLLSISGSEYGLVGTPEKDEALARVMATIGNACNPAFGAVEFYRSGSTTLESELLRLYQRNPLVGRSKEIVRSYSWIAVISEQAGTALGGVDTLRATGAFHEVTHLGQGGYLLRATRLFHEYTPAHAHRVFHALAPVLPSGMPDAWSRPWEPELIVREDAAEADRCPDRP